MYTQCILKGLKFQDLGGRKVESDFNGGDITSDAGGLLLREISLGKKVIHKFSNCFTDYRDGDRIDHTVSELLGQRIFAIALGYEDLNDHDMLRNDPLLATLVGKLDPTGFDRRREIDKGNP